MRHALTDRPARSRFGAFLHFLFAHDGRLGRGAYWLGLMAASAASGFLAGIAEQVVPGTGDIGRYLMFAAIIGAFAWIHSAVTVKRLHDRDKSGWWYWFYGFVPPASFIAATAYSAQRVWEPASILYIVALVTLLYVLFELGFLRGTPGPNRYGPPP